MSRQQYNECGFFAVFSNSEIWACMREFMWVGQRKATLDNYRDGDIAAYYGYVYVMKHNDNLRYSVDAIDGAAQNGQLAAVMFVCENRYSQCTTQAMDCAASNGFTGIVKYLHEKGKKITSHGINFAAAHGHTDLVKWIHNNAHKITSDGARMAAENGHFEIVKWFYLQINGRIGKLDSIAAHGQLTILKWLHQKGDRCTDNAMMLAAANGHLAVVQWYYEKYQMCASDVMHRAAINGHTDIVKWLYKYKLGRITKHMILVTKAGGHTELATWLEGQNITKTYLVKPPYPYYIKN